MTTLRQQMIQTTDAAARARATPGYTAFHAGCAAAIGVANHQRCPSGSRASYSR